MNSRQNCKLKVQIDTIRQLITICTQSHRPQTGEQSLPASIHIERRQLFILYVKLNFHETRLNFSQSAQAGLVETNLGMYFHSTPRYLLVNWSQNFTNHPVDIEYSLPTIYPQIYARELLNLNVCRY